MREGLPARLGTQEADNRCQGLHPSPLDNNRSQENPPPLAEGSLEGRTSNRGSDVLSLVQPAKTPVQSPGKALTCHPFCD